MPNRVSEDRQKRAGTKSAEGQCMAAENLPLRLTISSDLRLIPVVRDFVAAACARGRLSEAATSAVVLATNEAVNNIIRHAHQGRPEAPVQVECRLEGDGIEVRLL